MAETTAQPVGPLSRLLRVSVETIEHLTALRDAAPTDEEVREAFTNAQALAGLVLQSPASDPPVPAAAPGFSATELEEARTELRLAVAERDAARGSLAASQLVTTQLTNALAAMAAAAQAGGASGDGDSKGSGGYSNVPMFDGTAPREIRTWILLKLAAQSARYPTEQSKLRYAIGRLEGAAFNQVRSSVSEDTGAINFGTLNELLDVLRQAYDDPDRAATARKEVRSLKQKHLQFSAYLAEFRWLMGDLNWDDQAQRDFTNRP